MTDADLSDVYRKYIDCLNAQDWSNLGRFVDDNVSHNDRLLELSGYRKMLEDDFQKIPDLHFTIELLIADRLYVASRLGFLCTPIGHFLGFPVNGRKICFTENVFYEFKQQKISQVWSIIDRSAIESQL